jgi:PKD repeat protein
MKNFVCLSTIILFLSNISNQTFTSNFDEINMGSDYDFFSAKVTPVVDFTATINLIPKGNTVSFTDQSTQNQTSWIWNFQGGTPAFYIGKIPPPIKYNFAGSFDVSLTVVYADTAITTTKSDFIQVVNYPPGWSITQTGSSHLIYVPLSVTFLNDQLVYNDFIGVFYLDQNGNEKCGGAVVWDEINSKAIVAFGDDATTTTIKEGFAPDEDFIWKTFSIFELEEYSATVIYNASLPNSDGKFQDNGLSGLTTIIIPSFPLLELTATATPEEVCEGNSVQLVANVSGGSGNYSFSWSSTPAGFSSIQQNPTVIPLENTTYFVIVDDGFSNASSSVEVSVTPPPSCFAGSDVTICEGETIMVMGEAINHCGVSWQTNGMGYFDDPNSLIATYFPSPPDILNGEVELCLTALPCDPCTEASTDCLTLTLGKIQTITIPAGWNSISGFIEPFESDIEFIMSPAIQELIIMYNLEGETLFPEEEINTIINWDRLSGYVIKTSGNTQINLCGADPANKTIQLAEGWNLIPVLSEDDLVIEGIFLPILDKLIIIKDVAGTDLFYPEFGITTLSILQSGKAYLVKVSENCTVTF